MSRVVVVTGASRGIGKAIAEKFASLDYVVALISRHYEDIERVAQEFKRRDKACIPFECDVCNADLVSKTFHDVNKRFGSIDVLVNNAGVNSRRVLDVKNWSDNFEDNLVGWQEEININLTGTYICSYLAVNYMLKKGGGSIINISSIKGIEPTSSPGYGASKAGVIKLTKDFAKALAPYGIRVNCVAPGFINTGMTSELPDHKKEKYKEMIPQGRFGDVMEIANVVEFLASESASYINGGVINVSGGYLM